MQADSAINIPDAKKGKDYSLYIDILLTYLLTFILLFAGLSKIIDTTVLINNFTSVFSFLPETVAILIISLLPIIEIILGLLIILSLYNEKVKNKRRIILLTTTALFGTFFCYSIYGFITGNTNDCGCFGNAVKSSLGWGMIIRNTLFLCMSVFVFIRNKISNHLEA
jgi:heme/copper-type cytochrome/quinol oxidase subunit 4